MCFLFIFLHQWQIFKNLIIVLIIILMQKNSQKYKLYKQNYICIFISYQINFPCFINARRRLKLLKWWYVWVRYVFTVCWYWFKTQIRWTRDCLRDSSQGGAFSSFATSKLIFLTEFLQTSCFWKIYAEKFQTKASPAVDLKIQGLVTVAQCKIVTIHSKPVMLKKIHIIIIYYDPIPQHWASSWRKLLKDVK